MKAKQSVGEQTKWYDNWLITRSSDGKTFTKTLVSMPHSHSKHHRVYFKRISDARTQWLIELLDCALTELSNRDKEDNA